MNFDCWAAEGCRVLTKVGFKGVASDEDLTVGGGATSKSIESRAVAPSSQANFSLPSDSQVNRSRDLLVFLLLNGVAAWKKGPQ